MNYNIMKELLAVRLVPATTNLDSIPHKKIGDMALIYYFLVSETDDGVATIRITDEVLDACGVTAEQLHSDAMFYTQINCTATFRSMAEVIAEMLGLDCFDDNGDNNLWIASVKNGINGASVICYDGFLEFASDKLNSNLIILPSSIHEVIIMPDNDLMSTAELNDMISQINITEVNPEERLSDQAYYYDRNTKKLDTLMNMRKDG